MCTNGVVSSGHHIASMAGLKILMEGGNAFDAAISVSAASAVVKPQMSGLGGDAFVLLRTTSGEILALNSGGKAPLLSSSDKLLDLGHNYVPSEGILSIGVPGLVKIWKEIYQKYCTRKLAKLLNDAIYFAENGFPLYSNLATDIQSFERRLGQFSESRNIFSPNNNIPKEGTIFRQVNLASTLKSLVEKGIDSFYRGDVAREISRFCQTNGGWLSLEDSGII